MPLICRNISTEPTFIASLMGFATLSKINCKKLSLRRSDKVIILNILVLNTGTTNTSGTRRQEHHKEHKQNSQDSTNKQHIQIWEHHKEEEKPRLSECYPRQEKNAHNTQINKHKEEQERQVKTHSRKQRQLNTHTKNTHTTHKGHSTIDTQSNTHMAKKTESRFTKPKPLQEYSNSWTRRQSRGRQRVDLQNQHNIHPYRSTQTVGQGDKGCACGTLKEQKPGTRETRNYLTQRTYPNIQESNITRGVKTTLEAVEHTHTKNTHKRITKRNTQTNTPEQHNTYRAKQASHKADTQRNREQHTEQHTEALQQE